jgi:hypothetical protein
MKHEVYQILEIMIPKLRDQYQHQYLNNENWIIDYDIRGSLGKEYPQKAIKR